jgi:hypothetical protein
MMRDADGFTLFEKAWVSVAMLVAAIAGGFVFAVTILH